MPGGAVVQPPGDEASEGSEAAWARVLRWFDDASVPVLNPQEVVNPALELALA